MVLGDREVTVTLARVWHALSLWEKLKLTGTLLWTGLRCGGGVAMRVVGGGHAAVARAEVAGCGLVCWLAQCNNVLGWVGQGSWVCCSGSLFSRPHTLDLFCVAACWMPMRCGRRLRR